MKKPRASASKLRMGCSVLAIDLMIFALIFFAGLLLRWQSLSQFVSALVLAGLLLTAYGILTLSGGARSDVGTISDYSLSGAGRAQDYLRQISQDRIDRKGYLARLLAAALICLLVGLLLGLLSMI